MQKVDLRRMGKDETYEIDFSIWDHILKKDGFVIIIEGRRETGKTNVSLGIGEYCYLKGFRTKLATNIKTESYMVEKQITNLPDLKDWLLTHGKKLFILDEAGKHLRRSRFMSNKNIEIMDLVQLTRHYDCGFIFVASSERFLDSGVIDPDICDLFIHKFSWSYLEAENFISNTYDKICDIPATSIYYNDKDIADFKLERSYEDLEKECCKVALLYKQLKTFNAVGVKLGIQAEEVRRLLYKHIEHTV